MKLGTLQGAAALIAVSSALVLASGSAVAESACKGLAQDACEKTPECIWVGGYEKKDGKQVAGYCRAKGGGGGAEKAAPATAAPEKAKPAAAAPATETGKEKTK